LGDVFKILESVAAMFSKVYIVVDALDECEKATRDDLLRKITL
jgi:hypothetical protein